MLVFFTLRRVSLLAAFSASRSRDRVAPVAIGEGGVCRDTSEGPHTPTYSKFRGLRRLVARAPTQKRAAADPLSLSDRPAYAHRNAPLQITTTAPYPGSVSSRSLRRPTQISAPTAISATRTGPP